MYKLTKNPSLLSTPFPNFYTFLVMFAASWKQ